MSGNSTELKPYTKNQVNEQLKPSHESMSITDKCSTNDAYSNTDGQQEAVIAVVLYKPTCLQGRLSLWFQRLHGVRSNASHCALYVDGVLCDATFSGIYLTDNWIHYLDDEWVSCHAVKVPKEYAQLVMDRVYTLCVSGSRVRWSALLDVLKGKQYTGMTCVTFVQTVLGIPVDPSIKYPEQLLEQVQDEFNMFVGCTARR